MRTQEEHFPKASRVWLKRGDLFKLDFKRSCNISGNKCEHLAAGRRISWNQKLWEPVHVSQKMWQMKTLHFFIFPKNDFMRHLYVFKGALASHDFPSRCVGGPSYASCAMPIESSVIDGNEWRRSENQCPVSKKQSSMPFSRSQRNGPLSQRTPATDSQLRKICPIVGEGQTLFTTVSRRQHSWRQPHWLPWMTTTDYINVHPPFDCVWVFLVIY